MYIIRDVVTPAISSQINAMAFKNVMLRYWPSKTMPDGTVVLQKLYIWRKNQGVLQTPAHLAIYRKLGMKISDINAQSKKGLTGLWLEMSDLDTQTVNLTDDNISEYIEQFSPQIYTTGADPFNPILDPNPLTDLNPDPYKDGTLLDDDGEVIAPLWDNDGWITTYLTYQPLSGLGDPNIADADILAKCSGYNPLEVTFPAVDQLHRLTTIAMLDEEGAVFERETRILQRTIEERTVKVVSTYSWSTNTTTSRYLTSAKVEFRFRRVTKVVGPGSVEVDAAPLIARVQEVIASLVKEAPLENSINTTQADRDDYLARDKQRDPQLSMNRQLFRMYEYSHLDVGSWGYVVSEGVQGTYNSADADIAMRQDYLSVLSPREFAKAFSGHIVSGYDEVKAKWYEIVIVVILVIIIIIIAFMAYIGTFGASVGWGQAAIVLVIGSLALTALSMYWANQGKPGAARLAGNAAEYLGYAAMIAGLVSAYVSYTAQIAAESAKTKALADLTAAQASGSPTAALQVVYDKTVEVVSAHANAGFKLLAQVVRLFSELGVLNPDSTSAINFIAGAYEGMSDSFTSFDITALDFDVVVSMIPSIEELQDIVLTGFTNFTAQSTADIMNQSINTLNGFFNAYLKLVAPDAKALTSLEDEIRAQEKEIAALNVDNIDAVYRAVESKYSGICEVGDVFEKSYIHLTSGRNRLLMCKYYESGY